MPGTSAITTGQLRIALKNQSTSNNTWAYIHGRSVDGNRLFMLQSDGATPYYIQNPPGGGNVPIGANVGINLGVPGNTVYVTVPRLFGGRIWFSIGASLGFRVCPGPGLIEPSVYNSSDPNYNVNFGFCELTFNQTQLFANITYIDFVSIPISLQIDDTAGVVQRVAGMSQNGLQMVADGLRAQGNADGRRWSSLIISDNNGRLLRCLSPNSAIALNPSSFAGY